MPKPDSYEDRKDVLLKAAFDLLAKCNNSPYVLHAPAQVVEYDGADCDGSCLMEDIAEELGFDCEEEQGEWGF